MVSAILVENFTAFALLIVPTIIFFALVGVTITALRHLSMRAVALATAVIVAWVALAVAAGGLYRQDNDYSQTPFAPFASVLTPMSSGIGSYCRIVRALEANFLGTETVAAVFACT